MLRGVGKSKADGEKARHSIKFGRVSKKKGDRGLGRIRKCWKKRVRKMKKEPPVGGAGSRGKSKLGRDQKTNTGGFYRTVTLGLKKKR